MARITVDKCPGCGSNGTLSIDLNTLTLRCSHKWSGDSPCAMQGNLTDVLQKAVSYDRIKAAMRILGIDLPLHTSRWDEPAKTIATMTIDELTTEVSKGLAGRTLLAKASPGAHSW